MNSLNKINTEKKKKKIKAESLLQPDEKLEFLDDKKLYIIQGGKGERFSIDSLLLSRFIKLNNKEKMIDIGTGNGIIPFMTYHPKQKNKIIGIEIQKKLAGIAQRSIILNHLSHSIQILQGDIRKLKNTFQEESFDVMTANPPYFAIGCGKISEEKRNHLARHESTFSLEDLANICRILLKKQGRLYTIYRTDRLVHLFCTLCKYNIEPKYLQLIYTTRQNNSKRILLESRKEGGKGLTVLPPLFLN